MTRGRGQATVVREVSVAVDPNPHDDARYARCETHSPQLFRRTRAFYVSVVTAAAVYGNRR